MGTITLSIISIDEKINKLGKLFYSYNYHEYKNLFIKSWRFCIRFLLSLLENKIKI